ncbi:MAG TPA: DnaD domain protein [candidate division Zixibacteria bacterium]|nr:DnaD domain protein [candidate division Zixibacteria bacterium]
MVGFPGFPNGKLRQTQIPSLFFSELLPHIDDLAELKVTLYAFWSLSQKEGAVRFMRLADFLSDQLLMEGMGQNQESAKEALEKGIELSIARGTLLQVTAESPDGTLDLYFMNTEKGRAAVEGITRGQWRPLPDENEPITLMLNRPNIFVLYEQNIGSLTPLLADQLRDAEETYAPDWIEEAISLAVQNNARKWTYVLAILERWRMEGKRDGISRRDSQKELQGQIPEELRDIVKR